MFLSVQNYCKYIELQNEKAIFLNIKEANAFLYTYQVDSLDSLDSFDSMESMESPKYLQKYEPHGIWCHGTHIMIEYYYTSS